MPLALEELALRDPRPLRELHELFRAQRVQDADRQPLDFGTPVAPGADIFVDHHPCGPDLPARILLMHKPRRHICAMTDDQGRDTVAAYLDDAHRGCRHVGRLDFNTTGLLLWTSARRLHRLLLDPRSHLLRTYRVKIRDRIPPDDPRLHRLASGTLVLDDKPVLPCPVTWETHRTRATWIRFVLSEGRFRQIRRMCASVGFQIVKLERVAIGDLQLPETLNPRCIRPASPDQLADLFRPWARAGALALDDPLIERIAAGHATTRETDLWLRDIQRHLWQTESDGDFDDPDASIPPEDP